MSDKVQEVLPAGYVLLFCKQFMLLATHATASWPNRHVQLASGVLDQGFCTCADFRQSTKPALRVALESHATVVVHGHLVLVDTLLLVHYLIVLLVLIYTNCSQLYPDTLMESSSCWTGWSCYVCQSYVWSGAYLWFSIFWQNSFWYL